MTTFDELMTETRSKLSGAVGRDQVNVLNGLIDDTQTTITMTYLFSAALDPGSVLEIDAEQMLVMSTAVPAVTVLRGWNGTAATLHLDLSVVTIEPRFPRASIWRALVDELLSLPTGIFKVGTAVCTFPAGEATTNLTGVTTPVYRLLDAQRQNFDGPQYGWKRPDLNLLRNMPTATFASGYALTLSNGATYASAATVRVTYATPLTGPPPGFEYSTDVNSEGGLPASATDVLPLGAGSRLLLDKEALRVDMQRQGQSRELTEVPANYISAVAGRWRTLADIRISQEVTRLLAIYPYYGVA